MRSSLLASVSAAALILLTPLASARPVLIAPIRLAVPPASNPENPSDYYVEYARPVIDGDTLMVSATQRVISAPGSREAIHLFERASNASWTYAGVLMEGRDSAHFLHGNLAVVATTGGVLVFERGVHGWTRTATIESENGYDFPTRVENGAIYMRRYRPSVGTACVRADWVLRKVSGQWQEVATIGAPNCGDGRSLVADINDGRALVINQPPDLTTPQPPADILTDKGTASWSREDTLSAPQLQNPPVYIPWFGPYGTISSNWAYIEQFNLYRNTGGNNWVSQGPLLEPEVELGTQSYGGLLRGDTLVIPGREWDYELPNFDEGQFTEWRTLRVYRPRANGSFDYYARLNLDFSVYEGSVSKDGRRVAAITPDNNFFGPALKLFVFEIPDSVSFDGTQTDTFEGGNFARWTPTAGDFAVVTNEETRVLQQSSLDGDAGAYLTAADWQDQSIEADLRPLEFAGNDRWFGLVARRVDAQNFYYVTFRAPNTISLRRMRDGVYTELAVAYARAPFVPGRNYRIRLEAVGDQLAVFLDGMPRIHVKDQSFTHGHPGIAGYRTRFEVDNVIVSPATRLLTRLDSPERDWSSDTDHLSTGDWSFVYDQGSNGMIQRQADVSGNPRWFSKIAIGNQVVSARVRPMNFAPPVAKQDAWVGIAANVVDEQNYFYLTLRRSNQLSLRRLVGGNIEVLGSVLLPVTTGTWYDLRLEIINGKIRAFVNGDLKIQTTDPGLAGGGRNALLMYKTAADIASYISYQP